MPLAFLYLMALLAYVGAMLLLLVAAVFLALIPRFRSAASSLALGVSGSFAGVFAFQIVALPIALAIIWTLLVPIGYFHGGGHTTNPLVIGVEIGAFLIAAGLFASASLAGFVTGWSAAIARGEGIALRTFLSSSRVWRHVTTPFRRPYLLPVLLWLLAVWSVPGISGVRCWLNNTEIAVADLPGIYRAQVVAGPAMLELKPEGRWEYRLEGQSEPIRAGKWTFEPSWSDRSTIVVTFQGFALEAAIKQPGFVYSEFANSCAGKLRVCFGADDRTCFEQMRETVTVGGK